MKGGDHLQGAPDLLGLKTLEKGASHGFGITLHAEEFRKSTANGGRVFVSCLARLERELLIQGECCTTGNGLHVRFYKLSTAGKRRLAEAEFTWTSVALAVRSAEIGMKSIWTGLKRWFSRDAERREEDESHLAMLQEWHEAQGSSAEQARTSALKQLGR